MGIELTDHAQTNVRRAEDLRQLPGDVDPALATQATTSPPPHLSSGVEAAVRFSVRDILGVLWVLATAGAIVAPALVHGLSLGPFDYLSKFGLTQQAGVVVHSSSTADQINEFIPWSTLVWTQVHQGHLPLWNPYSALGTPLAFDWSSAPFSIPALIGYLVPVRLAFTVQVLVTLVIGGTGAYFLGRVLRLSVLGCVTAATVFEVSGSFIGWLGWPQAETMSWAGWLFGVTLLLIRGRHRVRDVIFLAVICACAIYAGQPETLLLLFIALAAFIVVLLAQRVPRLGGSGPILRPAFDVVVATIAGVFLGAPLLLPGYQLTGPSIRHVVPASPALPLHDLVHVVFQGFDGLPVVNSALSSGSLYFETAAYVGVIALVLAVTAVALRRQHAEVIAFAAVAVVTAALAFVGPLVSLMNALPFFAGDQWNKSLQPMDFSLAVLAGVGMDILVRSHAKRVVRGWLGGGFVVAGLGLAAVWVFGRGHLPPAQARFRADTFLWPVGATVLGLAVVGVLTMVHRRAPRHQARGRWSWIGAGRWAAFCLLACETAFLVTAGAPLLSSSPTFFARTPAEATLARAVGSSLVGFGTPCSAPSLGILPNANVAYGVHELNVYDPIIPRTYFSSWRAATGEEAEFYFVIFCPAVKTATAARRFGVGFVLEPDGSPGPTGSVFDKEIGDHEALYRIPGAAPATLTSLAANGAFPSPDAPGRPVPVAHPKPSSWKLETDAATTQVLRLRLTDVPGWHGTIDGRALKLEPFSGVMLQAIVPPGHHTIELSYWPSAFTVGIGLATCSAVGLLVAAVATRVRRRRKNMPIAAMGPGPA